MSTESAIRQKIIEIAIAMSESGLSPGRSGNVSARFGEGFLITPSGLAYHSLKIDDIVYMEHGGSARAASREPSSEWRFHHDIYRAYKTTDAIVHCHSRHATVLACCNREIPAFHYMVAAGGGKKIPIAPYALFGSQELSDHLISALDGYQAALMEHHGLVALGTDLQGAFELAHEIEELAAQYIMTLNLGSSAVLSNEQMAQVIERFKTYGKQGTE